MRLRKIRRGEEIHGADLHSDGFLGFRSRNLGRGERRCPGLATGAATLDELVDKLNAMIPELLELNAYLTGAPAPRFEVRATKDRERLTLVHAFA